MRHFFQTYTHDQGAHGVVNVQTEAIFIWNGRWIGVGSKEVVPHRKIRPEIRIPILLVMVVVDEMHSWCNQEPFQLFFKGESKIGMRQMLARDFNQHNDVENSGAVMDEKEG